MEDKKIKFNGMDVFIIIVVIAVAAAAIYLLFGRGDGGGVSASKNVEVTTVVELNAKDEDFTKLIKIGDPVLIGEKEKMRTNVTDMKIIPARTTGYDILDGRVLNSEVPNEYDVQITLVGEGTETDKSIEMNGTPIKVGHGVALNSKGWTGYGYVIGLDTADEN